MKTLLRYLVLLAMAPPLANAANMLYRQSFETPVESNYEIQWLTHGYALTQAVVSHQPHDGTKSVRGNFNALIVDPITNIRGSSFPQFKINFRDVPALRSWYPTTEKMFVSWWFKLDKCHWKGTTENNLDPLRVTGKYAYIRMNEEPATSYYFAMRGGASGSDVLSVNDANWMTLWQTTYGISALWLSNSGPNVPTHGADGRWHKLSFLIAKKPNGTKYLQWWIDDALLKADRFEADGKNLIVSEFVMDSIQFWHTASSGINLSETVEAGQHCNGWQIDDVQVWDDVPTRPRPPTPN